MNVFISNRHFQPGEGFIRGLLRDCETSNFALREGSFPALPGGLGLGPAVPGAALVTCKRLLELAVEVAGLGHGGDAGDVGLQGHGDGE